MINTQPIRRSAALIQFSKDHHFGLLLVWKIRQGLRFEVDATRIGKYINFFFENYLKEHFKEEEELLFTELDGNDDLRLSAEKDHEILAISNEKIKLQPDRANMKEFADNLEKHIRFEERLLFAHLQSSLDENRLNKIAQKMETSEPPKDDNWEDVFWVKN